MEGKLSTTLGMLKAEHDDLELQISEIRCWWEGRRELGRPNYGEMSRRVMDLRRCLSRHMEREEVGAFFDLAIEKRPELKDQTERLIEQHEQFRRGLDALAGKLTRGIVAYRDWEEPYRELDGILAELERHEEAENAIFQAALGGGYTDSPEPVHR